jgi:hypothetical protein
MLAPMPTANAGCAYRKSNPDIFVMQSAEDRAAKNTPALFTVRDRGASLSKAKCVRVSPRRLGVCPLRANNSH